MSQQIEDGGPAFPVLCDFKNGKPYQGMQTGNTCGWWEGLSIRDWFAGQALNGLLASSGGDWVDSFSLDAYELADAMLIARQPQSTREFRVGQTVRVKNSGHKFEIDSITKTIAGQTVYEADGQIWKPEEIEAVTA